MNKKMMAALMVAVMMLTACGAMAEGAYATPAPMQQAAVPATISVQGTAQIMADPDEVSVTANASVMANTVGSAQEAMNAIVASATEKLLALGVLDADVVTVDYGYDADGDGNNDTKVVTVDENGKAAIDTPARDGYTFKGWKTADGQDFDPSAAVTADVTIVAQWDKNPEPVKPSQPDKPAEPTKPAKPATQKPARADAKPAASATAQATAALPATGDTANNGLIAVLFASGAAMLVAAKKRLGLKD